MVQLRVVALSLLALLSGVVAAQPVVERVGAARVDRPPVIDGNIEDSEWGAASRLEGFTDALTGKEPDGLRTVAWLAYDSEAIYVAFRCWVSPDKIVARETQEGADLQNDDRVALILNPNGTRRWDGRWAFVVSAGNVRREDIPGGRTGKREWRGVWQSGAKRLEDGYSVEFRIPWAMLEYPNKKSLDMDFNLERSMADAKLGVRWRNSVQNQQPDREPIWEGVQPPPMKNLNKVDLLIFGSPEVDEGTSQFRAGLDARTRPTQDTTAVLTLFPDFRNIESEIESIDFSRTERFIGESRPFFAEGSGYFGLTSGFTFGRMFYSRRIRDVDVGAKVFGQIDQKTSVGALATTSPDQDAAVFKVGHNWTPRSNFSLWGTYSRGLGRRNTTTGGAAYVKSGNIAFDTQFAFEHPEGRDPNAAGAVSVQYEAPKVFAILRHQWIEPDFEGPLALIPWRDRVGAYLYVESWSQYRKGPYLGSGFNVFATQFQTYEGEQQERGWELSGNLNTRRDVSFYGGVTNFEFFGLKEETLHGGVTFDASNRFRRIGLNWRTGKQDGEEYRFLNANVTRRVLGRLDLNLSVSSSRLGEVDEEQVILTAGYEIDRTRSLTGRLVSDDRGTNAYLAYRNTGGRGIDWFVILGDPNSSKTRGRIAVKFVFAL